MPVMCEQLIIKNTIIKEIFARSELDKEKLKVKLDKIEIELKKIVDQEVVESDQVCFDDTLEKCCNNVILCLAFSTYYNLNVDIPTLSKKNKDAKPDMLNIIDVSLRVSLPKVVYG
jgi:hypothetical protein